MSVNIGSYSNSTTTNIVVRNLDVVSLDAETIRCQTLTIAGDDEIALLEDRLADLEDRILNISRDGTITEFQGSIKTDKIQPLTTPEVTITPAVVTSGDVTTTGAFNADGDMTIGTTLYVKESTGRVGINQSNPAYSLDVTGSLNCSGNFTMAGEFYGSVIRNTIPVTASGNIQTFIFPDSNVKRFVIGFNGFQFTASTTTASNNLMINLGTSSTTIGTNYAGGFYFFATPVGTGSATCGAFLATTTTNVLSGPYYGQIVFTYLGGTVWSWDGSWLRVSTNNAAYSASGTVDVGASIVDRVIISLSTSTTTYTFNTNSTLSGSVAIAYHS